MRRKLKLKILDSTPCTRPWNTLQGGDRERYCAACDKHVHNFAAMTAREIERLVRERDGRLCARVVYRADGSIRTADGASQPSVAARLVLASTLVFPTALAAQSAGGTNEVPVAHLSGKILKPDSSGPMAGAFVALLSNHQIVASAHADQSGDFDVSAPPGRYDIAFGSSLSDAMRIPGYELRPGTQNLNTLPLLAQSATTVTVEAAYTAEYALGGAMTATFSRPRFFWFFFQHPVAYVRSFRHGS
jgi:hypothetical protein